MPPTDEIADIFDMVDEDGNTWAPPGFAYAMDYERTAGGIGCGAPASVWMGFPLVSGWVLLG